MGFTIIFYYHAVMNTFTQWQETISDTYLTDTPPCFAFIEPNISLLPTKQDFYIDVLYAQRCFVLELFLTNCQ